MAKSAQLSLQDPASPVMCQLSQFHDHVMVIIMLIMTLVGCAMICLMKNKLISRYTMDAQTIETVWTILPAVILIFIAAPSLQLLYIMEEVNNPFITVKAIGHQWYWEYEYSDFSSVSFDAYMLPTEWLKPGEFRLLETDNRIVLPMNTEIRMMITAADVLHAWTIPSLGVKSDAVPGRLNQVGFNINRPGVFYGQCSEICGANHSFMPIALESVSWGSFQTWINNLK